MADTDRGRDRRRSSASPPPRGPENNVNKIYVGGLDFTLKRSEIMDVFEEAGRIAHIQLVTEHETGRFKGYCFITYETASAYDYAINKVRTRARSGCRTRSYVVLNVSFFWRGCDR